ncbi:hypothetical protein [Priestia megaterium]|uniref:hypothetical protein n=1 Tax=Priestia megaterium TaxID=1404 RepID=UPI000BF2D49C|nr:hypothetical protein [Priestia megaterium]PEU72470.1 hypothetical protein CN397_06220 [Priestia megaterium]PFQ85502.1 hypothetical protein COK11_08515 [Priestia megaterium]
MYNLQHIFETHNFELTNETTKGVEYRHQETGDIVYLLPTKEINLVVNPLSFNVDLSQSDGKVHSTALKHFPKRLNGGKQPISFGYSFKFPTAEALSDFLYTLNN